MQSFSREAAAAFAQNEIQQRRIERIKAVRNKEKKLAKQQTASYSELKQSAQKQIEHEMHQKWQTQKNQQLQKIKKQYNRLKSSVGAAHHSAHHTTDTMNATAVANQQKLQQQNRIATQRARTAISKLQQKILDEQNEREIRAKWRYNAIELAKIHRNKLALHLQHQYIILPPGLSPQNSIHSTNNNNNNNNNNRRNLINSDPRFNQSHRYTLVTSHNNSNNNKQWHESNGDTTQFNPHPKLFLKQMDQNQAIDPNAEQSKIYNLREYLPPKLLKRLNKKYSKQHKKQKRRKKKQKKFKAAGITLKSDGSQMMSIPEEKTLSEQGSVSSQSKFHSIPSHLQANERKQCEKDTKPTANPWAKAKQIRQQTAEKEKKQTQQFLKAQKRGKIALEKEIQKTKAKQLECDLELIHQKLIQEKLQKCQKLIESTNSSNKLQAELEEKFEDLFQIHSKPTEMNETKKEKIQTTNVENKTNKIYEETKVMEQEMKPRNNIPQPQSYSSSSSRSASPPNITKKKKLQLHSRKTILKQVKPKSLPSPLPISVSIPTVKPCHIQPHREDNITQKTIVRKPVHNDQVQVPFVSVPHSNDMKENLSESDDDDDDDDEDEANLSVTRSRRVKIQRNNDGSTSVSESTSIATSVSGSPQKENINTMNIKDDDQVIVPKKWFESLIKQIDDGSPSVMTSVDTISSRTVDFANVNIKTHGDNQVAMKRTWFEQLLQDVYKKKTGEGGQEMKDSDDEEEDIKNMADEEEEDKNEIEPEQKAPQQMDTSAQEKEIKKTLTVPRNHEVASSHDEDEYNLIFKRKKPISVLSEMMSDTDANDADDEYDPNCNQKPNNLRQSIDSDASQMDNDSISDLSTLNIRNANKFIRESEALLNQTANFFDNFSDGSSSMDFTKMDKSVRKSDVDSLLRSSVQSDSSQWSLSSLSSMEFSTLPSSLQKFDNFLSDNKSKNTEHKNMKTPMQTIKEMPTPSSSTTFTIRSDNDDKDTTDTPNTPKPFGDSSIVYNAHRAKNIDNGSSFEYHSEEEKASSPANEIKNLNTEHINKLTQQHLITPTASSGTRSSTVSNPRFTDGTVNSYPSLPPSNRGSVLKKKPQQNNQSLLPIQHLDFMDINVSNIKTNSTNSIPTEAKVSVDSTQNNSITLNELKKFNDEMNDTLNQILELKINGDQTRDDNESFLHSMDGTNDVPNNNDKNLLDSINVSEITKSNHSTAKLSQLSTSSFSTSTFMNEGPLAASEQTKDEDVSTLSSMSLTRIESTVPKLKFPPLTPQDLMVRVGQNALNKTIEIEDTDDDDMELDTGDTESSHTQQTLERQNAGYFDMDEEDDIVHKIPTNAVSWRTNQNQSFRFTMNSLDDHMMQHDVNNDNEIMCVGDLEIVKEEPESESNKNYAEFVGIGSEATDNENDSDLQNMSLQHAWRDTNRMTLTASQLTQNKHIPQIDIGKKLEILKQRGKQRKIGAM